MASHPPPGLGWICHGVSIVPVPSHALTHDYLSRSLHLRIVMILSHFKMSIWKPAGQDEFSVPTNQPPGEVGLHSQPHNAFRHSHPTYSHAARHTKCLQPVIFVSARMWGRADSHSEPGGLRHSLTNQWLGLSVFTAGAWVQSDLRFHKPHTPISSSRKNSNVMDKRSSIKLHMQSNLTLENWKMPQDTQSGYFWVVVLWVI